MDWKERLTGKKRRVIHATEEERLAARRESQRKYFARKQAERKALKEKG
jgi:hypothetical protein